VQQLLKLPDSTPNPHLWYEPRPRWPKVADTVAADLSAIQPSHKAYFEANAAAFKDSLGKADPPRSRASRRRTPACLSPPREPVADYLLTAARRGTTSRPWTFQADKP